MYMRMRPGVIAGRTRRSIAIGVVALSLVVVAVAALTAHLGKTTPALAHPGHDCAPIANQWSAVLTSAPSPTNSTWVGYLDNGAGGVNDHGELSCATFSMGGTVYEVRHLYTYQFSGTRLSFSLEYLATSSPASVSILNGMVLHIGNETFAFADAIVHSESPGVAEWRTPSFSLSSGQTAQVQIRGGAFSSASVDEIDDGVRRSDVFALVPEQTTEFWFPTNDHDCSVEEERQPDPEHCGLISLPVNMRDQLAPPVNALAQSVYATYQREPTIPLIGLLRRPAGTWFDLDLWATYPHPSRGSVSVTSVTGPYESSFRVCLPHAKGDGGLIARYNASIMDWDLLAPTMSEHAEHACAWTNHLGVLALVTADIE